MENSFIETLKNCSKRYENFISLVQEKGWSVKKHRRFSPQKRGLFELWKYDTKVNIIFRIESPQHTNNQTRAVISSIKTPFYFEEFDAFVINGYHDPNDIFMYPTKSNSFLSKMLDRVSWRVSHKFEIPTNWDLLDKILFTKNPNLLFDDIPEKRNFPIKAYSKCLEYLKQHGWSVYTPEDQTTATVPGLFKISKQDVQENIYIADSYLDPPDILTKQYDANIDVIMAASPRGDIYIVGGKENCQKFEPQHINNIEVLGSVSSVIKTTSLRHVTIADGLDADIHISEDGSVIIKNSDQNITVRGKNILISS